MRRTSATHSSPSSKPRSLPSVRTIKTRSSTSLRSRPCLRAALPAVVIMAMVEAAVERTPLLEASTIEIDRGGETYTADTLAEAAEKAEEYARGMVTGGRPATASAMPAR